MNGEGEEKEWLCLLSKPSPLVALLKAHLCELRSVKLLAASFPFPMGLTKGRHQQDQSQGISPLAPCLAEAVS